MRSSLKIGLVVLGVLFLSVCALARPGILVVQTIVEQDKEKSADYPMASMVAKALDDTGKVDALVYSPTTGLVSEAVTAKKIAVAPERPSVEQASSIGKAINFEFTLMFTAVKNNDALRVVATLYKSGSSNPSWSVERNEFITIAPQEETSTTDWNTTALSIARTISMMLATDTFKDVAITKATGDDPKQLLPAPTPRSAPVPLPAADREAFRTGQMALEEGRAKDAIALLREAVDAEPMNPQMRVALAKAYLLGDMKTLALDEIKRSKALMNDDPALNSAYARILVETGEPDQGIALYEQILAKTPNDVDSIIGLGDAYYGKRLITKAIEQYRDAAHKNDKNHEPFLKLAYAYLSGSEYENAMQAFSNAKAKKFSMEPRAQRDRYIRQITVLDDAITRLITDLATLRQDERSSSPDRAALDEMIATLVHRTEGLATYLEKMETPVSFGGSHQAYLLSAQLVAQAAAAMKLYTETQSSDALDDVQVLRSDAIEALKKAQKAYSQESVTLKANQ